MATQIIYCERLPSSRIPQSFEEYAKELRAWGLEHYIPGNVKKHKEEEDDDDFETWLKI
jgi:hypothetical protein